MATKTINVRFQQKIDTAANWTTNNTVLLPGELGVESDTGLFKIGRANAEGNNIAWNDLAYANEIPEVDLSTVTNAVKVAATLEELGNGTVVGDMGIVKAPLYDGSDSYTHTAYVWNGAAWAAMDGNYSASNVFLPADIVLAGDYGTADGKAVEFLGNYRKGTTISAGTSIEAVFNGLFTKEIATNLQNAAPTTTINATKDTYLLVGANSTAQTVTLTLNKGSYDNGYGYVDSKNETGIEAGTKAKTVVTNDGTGVETNKFYFNGTAQDANSYTVASTSKDTAPSAETIKAKISYKNAGSPVSNLKNIYPAQKLADGTTAEVSATLNKWYYPIYQGFTYADTAIADHANITAAQLEALGAPTTGSTKTSKKIVGADAYNKTKLTKAVATKAWRQYYVAYPASYNYVMSAAKDANNIDCTVREAANVTFTYNGIDVPYKVYYIHNGSDYGTKTITWTM